MTDIDNIYEDLFVNNRLVSFSNTANLMYAKVTEVFRYENLPLTIPKRILEGMVTRNGAAVVYEYNDELFVTDATPGTGQNLYDEATEVTIEHRVGRDRERLTRTVGINAVMVRNDALCIGLETLITEYAILTAQAKITMLRNLVDLRGNYIIQAKDKNAFNSAVEYENAIRRGDTAVILAEEFDNMEGIVVHNTPISNNPATQTIELYQYIQSMYYSELGISLNNNMKREYVSDSEMEKSTGMPLIYNMLNCRLDAVRDINALFGTDISVCLSEEWNDEKEADNGPVATEGEDPSGFEEGVPAEGSPETEPDPEAEADAEAEGPTEEVTEEEPEAEPEAETPEVTEEELVEATEALLGEDIEETDDDTTTDDTHTEADDTKDNAGRGGMDTEEKDD